MNTTLTALGRRLRLGVVGGGPGSFIGPVHRTAARLDDHYEVVAGVLSRDPERSRAAATAIGIAPDRAYGDHAELIARRSGARRRHRRARDHDPERPAPRGGARRAGARARRDLRQAAHHHARRRAGSGAAGAAGQSGVLRDLQLQRLPDGPPRPRDGRRTARSARSARSRSSTSRATSRRGPRPTTIRPQPGASPTSSAAPRWCWATSGRMPITSRATSPARRWSRSRPRSAACCRAARSTTSPICCCASRVARGARCGSPTRPPAASMVSQSGCSASMAASSGTRRIRTTCSIAASAAFPRS